ncbi:hypothetical protein J6590_003062 [Homalodisca vitripennis]|nr:hypothetical protein J6590_003062 [Homalodisca vitripennis]
MSKTRDREKQWIGLAAVTVVWGVKRMTQGRPFPEFATVEIWTAVCQQMKKSHSCLRPANCCRPFYQRFDGEGSHKRPEHKKREEMSPFDLIAINRDSVTDWSTLDNYSRLSHDLSLSRLSCRARELYTKRVKL